MVTWVLRAFPRPLGCNQTKSCRVSTFSVFRAEFNGQGFHVQFLVGGYHLLAMVSKRKHQRKHQKTLSPHTHTHTYTRHHRLDEARPFAYFSESSFLAKSRMMLSTPRSASIDEVRAGGFSNDFELCEDACILWTAKAATTPMR